MNEEQNNSFKLKVHSSSTSQHTVYHGQTTTIDQLNYLLK